MKTIHTFAVTLILLVLSGDRLFAQNDIVVMTTGKDQLGRYKNKGTIEEYTGRELLLRAKSGKIKVIATNKIHSIQTTRCAEQLQGNQLLQKYQYAQALKKYRAALKLEKRNWMRREIFASMVWCYRGLNNINSAASLAIQLIKSDPTTPYFNSLPLAWNSTMAERISQKQAVKWLNDDLQPAAKLLGASYLLSGPHRTDAIQTLKNLSIHQRLQISLIAAAQLWRTQVNVHQKTLDRWETSIRKLPEQLQPGPYYLLGQTLANQNQHQAAALAFMRSAIFNSPDRKLSSECLSLAGDSLLASNQKKAAAKVYVEITKKYRDLPVARHATAKIEKIRNPPN